MKRCLICDGNNWGREIGVGKKFKYIFCRDCKNWILFPQGYKISIYNSKYFDNPSPKSPLITSIYRLAFYRSYTKLIGHNIKKVGRILDVGCGDGNFLFDMERFGWDVYGTDVTKSLSKKLFKRINRSNLYFGELYKIKKLKSSMVDCITFWHVAEHLKNPTLDFKKAFTILKKKGTLFIEVPNGDSLIFKVFGMNYNWLCIPEHTIYWTKNGLNFFLYEIGFKKIDIYSVPKANLNFAFSFHTWLLHSGLSRNLSEILFICSIPLSITVSFALSFIGKGEVLRVIAKKN